MVSLIPFIGRLSFTDYWIILLVNFETFLSLFLNRIPQSWLNFATELISIFTPSPKATDQYDMAHKIRTSEDIVRMCSLFNISVEEHIVRTEDNYLLTIHRIPPGYNSNGKIVYLHHGLLMCSDIWCCNIYRTKNLAFVLHDLGYDVWLGNNRGNKYSTTHLNLTPKSSKFWDFSIDEFAFFDIPNSIDFVLDFCKVQKLICIGFSQGSAQMFASLSIREDLNDKVSMFIAISPAMTPKGLHNRIVDAMVKSSPLLMYLFFGNKIVLPSATIWQKTLHPTIFNMIIDRGNKFLFNWKSKNITPWQKVGSYAKLYSTTSVKCIVHWFQILNSQKFQMFEESDDVINSFRNTRPYRIASFPTKTNIKIPVLLIYGGVDSLVDIQVMKQNLPDDKVFDIEIGDHEHLDLLWGDDVDKLVIPNVLRFINFFSEETDETTLTAETPKQYEESW